MAKIFKTMFTGYGGYSISSALQAMELPLIVLLTTVLSVYVMGCCDKLITSRAKTDSDKLTISVDRGASYITVVWCIVIGWLILLASDAVSSFIYFQF
jgi:hypothetical protein